MFLAVNLGAHSRRVMVSWDNAACESFMKTLKYEGVQPQRIPDLAEAKAATGEFWRKPLNRKRLYSAMGHLPLAEFELNLVSQQRGHLAASDGMSVFRHWKL